ncbi:MAG TPA: isoprenylcysteine carboxylmethyltransferase family protein [Anaerolineales bacterium]|nr:isoprenylcysteine carboxylmethyltransferase family protein [Anaerolineales bacterium]
MTESLRDSNLESPAVAKGKIIFRILIYLVFLGIVLFLLAGTIQWTMGWVFLAVFGILTTFSAFLVPVNEEMKEERTKLKEDVKQWDKYLAGIPSLLFPLGFTVVGALDYRFGWSGGFPLWLTMVAIIIGMAGYMFSGWAAKVNRFYARFVRIQTERGHHAITNGPYQVVRHPGYAGLIVYCLAAPVMLESYWAFVPVGLIVVILVVRTALEDKTLIEELPGYSAYIQQTRYRLIPGIW